MTDIDPRIRVCAVCARVLDFVTDRGWAHVVIPFDNDEHVAVPVRPGEVEVDGRCDFCYAVGPRWVVPARDFFVPDMADQASAGDWSACDECAALIGRNQWSALVRRVAASWFTNHGTPMPDETITRIRRLYRDLRAAIRGPIRPLKGWGRESQADDGHPG